MDELVWYVAYGSNLSTERFQRYLDRCPDPTPAGRSSAQVLPHRLFFAHASSIWEGGGTAFVDPTVSDAETRCVARLVTLEQFLHVLAAENGSDVSALAGLRLPSSGTTVRALPGRYGLVVGVESPDSHRAFTFTTGAAPLPAPTRPSLRYARTIADGLREFHGLGEADSQRYLAAHGGSPEVGLVPDSGEELADGLERSAVGDQRSDVAADAEITGDEGVEGGSRA